LSSRSKSEPPNSFQAQAAINIRIQMPTAPRRPYFVHAAIERHLNIQFAVENCFLVWSHRNSDNIATTAPENGQQAVLDASLCADDYELRTIVL
jgi:hypothetical protein